MSKESKIEPVKQEGKNELNIWQISTAVFALLLIVVLYWGITKPSTAVAETCTGNQTLTGQQNQQATGILTSQQASDKTMKYINEQILQGRSTATLKSITELNMVYLIKISVGGQDADTYVTKDGKYFFLSPFDIDETLPVQETQEAQTVPKTAKPEVHLYTMSYCPYGNQAEDVAAPVVKLLGSKVEIQPHYVIYSNYGGGGPNYCLDNESKYCSMHGIQELNQDVRELCIYKYQKDKYWDFVLKVNTACNYQNVDSCWEAVAKTFSIDTEKIKTCEKDEAIALLKTEVELNTKYAVHGSPALVINGVQSEATRTPEGYKQGICAAFTNPPAECNQTINGTTTTTTGSC